MVTDTLLIKIFCLYIENGVVDGETSIPLSFYTIPTVLGQYCSGHISLFDCL